MSKMLSNDKKYIPVSLFLTHSPFARNVILHKRWFYLGSAHILDQFRWGFAGVELARENTRRRPLLYSLDVHTRPGALACRTRRRFPHEFAKQLLIPLTRPATCFLYHSLWCLQITPKVGKQIFLFTFSPSAHNGMEWKGSQAELKQNQNKPSDLGCVWGWDDDWKSTWTWAKRWEMLANVPSEIATERQNCVNTFTMHSWALAKYENFWASFEIDLAIGFPGDYKKWLTLMPEQSPLTEHATN